MDKNSIAHEAYGLVHGERAQTYGHPRIDFQIIAQVWTGLLQDVLKDGAQLDEYRVAVLMTGLKLARLVKSPDYRDSRVDVIGYMLTMERLDEPAEEAPTQADAFKLPGDRDPFRFVTISLWLEPYETKYVNGHAVTNPAGFSQTLCVAVAPGENPITIYKHPPKAVPADPPPFSPDFGLIGHV